MENQKENQIFFNDENMKSSSNVILNNKKLMKKGDYTVHVLIEEIKNLKVDKENYLPKPIIKITCFGTSKRTSKPPNDCEAYTFNEHLYFDSTDLSIDILDSSKILIEAYDYHNFEREYYFGIIHTDRDVFCCSSNEPHLGAHFLFLFRIGNAENFVHAPDVYI